MASFGGLLDNPRLKRSLLVALAAGGDPRKGGQLGLLLNEQELQREQAKRDEEDRAQQKAMYELQMKQMQDAQRRDENTRGALASMATLSPQDFAMYQANPQFQANFRASQAAGGNPQLAELGGLLQPVPEPMKPTKEIQNLLAAGVQPGTPEWNQAMTRIVMGKPDQAQIVEQGGVQYYADGPRAGQPVLPEGTSSMDPEKQFTQEKALRGEVADASKAFMQVQDAYGRIATTAKNPSAAGDLALIFNYMKMLDPGSTVREGEFATAQNAAGIPARIRAQWNKIKNGERLTEEQRADFLKQSQNLYTDAVKGYEANRDYYSGLAGQYNVNPARVLTPPARYDAETLSTAISEAEAYLKGVQQ